MLVELFIKVFQLFSILFCFQFFFQNKKRLISWSNGCNQSKFNKIEITFVFFSKSRILFAKVMSAEIAVSKRTTEVLYYYENNSIICFLLFCCSKKFKKEFEILSAIRTPYCVQVMSTFYFACQIVFF